MPGSDRAAALPAVGPGARRLLDLIARAEGTSGPVRARHGYASDYDVTFGYGTAEPPGPRKPLSQMSIDEARALQRTMRGSSAIGRYQFMPATLRGLCARHGLAGDERMDGPLQDALARSLLREKGYDAYGCGAVAAEAVLDGLAQLWASLPDAVGRSRWTFRGRPQPVGTTRAALRAALEAARRLDFGGE
jgi:hypothetical protein